MLLPRSHAWTRMQRWLIAGGVVAGLAAFSVLVYTYEHYYRGPDDTVLVGTWRGEYVNTLGDNRTGYRFKPDHTYEELLAHRDSESWMQGGRWRAGGDFIYLRVRLEDASGPYDTLQAWHIDTMTSAELHMHYDGLHVALKRAE